MFVTGGTDALLDHAPRAPRAAELGVPLEPELAVRLNGAIILTSGVAPALGLSPGWPPARWPVRWCRRPWPTSLWRLVDLTARRQQRIHFSRTSACSAGRCWCWLSGQPAAADRPGKGRFCYQICRKAVSASFTTFLAQLLATYPAAPVVAVICGNVIIHHSKVVLRWLAAHPRVVVLHGARYSPHDNPVERIWGSLKAWLANAPTLTIQSRIRQVHAFFRQRSPTQLLATAASHSSPWLPAGHVQNFRQAA